MQTIYFVLAVAAVSAIIFALTTRADRISDRISRRRASSDGSYDPGLSSGSDGWSAASWWFGNHSSQFTDTSGSWDSGGGFSGGDGGGGGSDGGGGGGSSD